MKVLRTTHELKVYLKKARQKTRSVGFVPTMGYLHEGHLSLARRAKKENDVVVVSIFVNPLQFGPQEDLRRYPRNLARDKKLLKREGVDFLFKPDVKNFYLPDFETAVTVKHLSEPLCGRARPTHFGGVCAVVLKLLNSVMPDAMYLGQKDYQQFRVLSQMVKDLDFPTDVRMCPIVRELDGLAMSSRNVFLTRCERAEAPVLRRILQMAARLIQNGSRESGRVRKAALLALKKAAHARPDYLEIVDADTLRPMVKLTPGKRVLIAGAVVFGKTRLIDNILIKAR